MPKKRILVVEDNRLNREMLCEILTQKYAVVEAENGQQALEILEQNRMGIDLILLDLMMPVMDGMTFLKRISEDEELALIPVIVMTQSDSERDEDYRKRVIQHLSGQYQIWETGNVKDAIELAKSYRSCISLVILSVSLPDQGASVFLGEMRRDLILWRIPVLSTMPLCDVSDELIMELDTEDFLCKRHPMRDLQKRVDCLLGMASLEKRKQALYRAKQGEKDSCCQWKAE